MQKMDLRNHSPDFSLLFCLWKIKNKAFKFNTLLQLTEEISSSALNLIQTHSFLHCHLGSVSLMASCNWQVYTVWTIFTQLEEILIFYFLIYSAPCPPYWGTQWCDHVVNLLVFVGFAVDQSQFWNYDPGNNMLATTKSCSKYPCNPELWVFCIYYTKGDFAD